jgi:hypothetical protein
MLNLPLFANTAPVAELIAELVKMSSRLSTHGQLCDRITPPAPEATSNPRLLGMRKSAIQEGLAG